MTTGDSYTGLNQPTASVRPSLDYYIKGDLAIRPIFHQLQARIEAHIFVAFLAYCLHVTLARRLHALAPGLTPRSVLEKFAAVQMIDLGQARVPTDAPLSINGGDNRPVSRLRQGLHRAASLWRS